MDENNIIGKLKRGGQPGNRNARKHGFYSSTLDRTQKTYLVQAVDVVGLAEEIDLLRVKLKTVLKHDPDNSRLIIQFANTLVRLARVHYQIGGNTADTLNTAIGNIIHDIGIPLGVINLDLYKAEWEKNYLEKLQKEHKQIVEISAQPNP